MRQQLKLWDSKRERKLTGPNTLPTVHRTKGPSKSRGASWLRIGPSPLEAGGRGEGKGANSAPEVASPTKLQTGLQFLTKDFLRFWMVDIRREGCGEIQGAGTQPARAETETGTAKGRRRAAPRESAPVKLLAA